MGIEGEEMEKELEFGEVGKEGKGNDEDEDLES